MEMRSSLASKVGIVLLLGFGLLSPEHLDAGCQSGLGGTLVSDAASYQVRILPGNPLAVFTSDIFFDNNGILIGSSRDVGKVVSIGQVAAGTEMVFRIFVRNTRDNFFSGPANRNPDGVAHANVGCIDQQTTIFSFEDIFGGGDRSFNDAIFEVTAQPGQKRFSPEQKAEFAEASARARLLAAGLAAVAVPCGFFPEPGPTKVCFAITAGSSATAGLLSAILAVMATDPPDPNFTVIAQPMVLALPPLEVEPGVTQAEVEAINGWLRNRAEAIAVGRALITSLNRADGAAAAGDSFWEDQQLKAASEYAVQLAKLLEADPALRALVQDALEEASFPAITVTASDVSTLQQTVAQNGLPDFLIEPLTQLGAHGADLAQIKQALITTDPTAAAGSLSDYLVGPKGTSATAATIQALRDFSLQSGTVPPTVEVVAPNNGALLRGKVGLAARASDNVGVVGVKFLLDNADLGDVVTTPGPVPMTPQTYSSTWDTRTGADGPHALAAVASDAADNSTKSAPLTVTVDNTPPTLTLHASPSILWPPNHKLVAVTVTVNVADNTDPNPSVRLDSITCNDACAPTSDIAGAAYGTDDRRFQLRAERTGGGSGRTYTITYSAGDAAGNTSTASTMVLVPHDQGHRGR